MILLILSLLMFNLSLNILCSALFGFKGDYWVKPTLYNLLCSTFVPVGLYWLVKKRYHWNELHQKTNYIIL